MAQISRFWDGTALGDAVVAPYDAGTEFSEVMTAVAGASRFPDRGGVIETPLGTLDVSSPAAGVVRVSPGEALVYGAWYRNDANVDHSIPAPAAAPRIDRIILRKSWTSQTVRQILLSGTEGGSAPVLTRTVGATWDVPIAQINVAVGGAVTITDQRIKLGIPDVAVIFTDPVVRDTLFFGAKPAGSPDAMWQREGPNALRAPNHNVRFGIANVDGTQVAEKAVKYLVGGSLRWFWGLAGGTTEPGGNVGSDLGLYRYADDGSFLGAIVGFRRSDALISFQGFAQFHSSTQWGGAAGQRVAQEGPNLVWRRQSDSGGTMVLGDDGSLSTMGNIASGVNMVSNGGTVYAGATAGNYMSMTNNGALFANNGQSITVNPSSAYFHGINGTVRNGHPSVPWYDVHTAHVSCTGQGVFDGGVRGNGGVFVVGAAANIQLAPTGGYVHPDGNGVRHLGHTSLHWGDVYANRLYSAMANPLLVEAGVGSVEIRAHGAGSPVNLITDTGQMQFQTGDGYAIMPVRHNTVHMGSNALRWMDGWGVGGWNGGSTREWKQNWSDLPEGQALAALRLMRFGRFEYKLPKGLRAEDQEEWKNLARWSVGYIAEDTVAVTRLVGGEDLFVSRTGKDVEPQRTASVIGAAVQDLDRELHNELAMLKARIVELERERVYANV